MSKCDKNCTDLQHKCVDELKEIGTLRHTNEGLQTKVDENVKKTSHNSAEIYNLQVGVLFSFGIIVAGFLSQLDWSY